jgi:predicted amidohydrolase YtcJ
LIADLILINGKIVTVDSHGTIAEAVAVKFGRILAVGSNEDIKLLMSEGTEVLDLEGRTVLPGFIDSHCHFTSFGIQRIMAIDCSYESGVRCIRDIQDRIRGKAKITPKGEWINVVQVDDSKLVEKRFPTRWELDEAAPDHPVCLATVGGHFYIFNSKAFELAGITKGTPDPPGGRFERDPVTGELTGGVHERAKELVQPIPFGRLPREEEVMEGIKLTLKEYASAGLTCAYDGWTDRIHLRALQRLREAGELPIRVRVDVYYTLLPDLDRCGVLQGLGDDWLKICGIKVVCDGAISARTAAVSQPYLHKPNYYGELAITGEELRRVVLEGYGRGYRFCVHANGDRAINMCLDVLEEAQERYPRRDPRNRIIHCTVVNPAIIERLKKLNILPTIFGAYPYYHGDKILPAFGAERLQWMFAARSMLDAGLKVAAHSDHPASPYPPLLGIHSLVNRRSARGVPIGERQKVSVMEAIKLYTINAAYHSFDEDKLGSIEPGKLADFVVLGEDILTIPTERIKDIPVEMTIIEGRIIYRRG